MASRRGLTIVIHLHLVLGQYSGGKDSSHVRSRDQFAPRGVAGLRAGVGAGRGGPGEGLGGQTAANLLIFMF